MTAREILNQLNLKGELFNDCLLVKIERENFADICTALHHEYQLPLVLVFGADQRQEGIGFSIQALFSLDQTQEWLMISTRVPETDPRYPSLTKTIMAAHWYERYLMDMFGVIAEGHPEPHRLVHHENVPKGVYPLRKDFSWDTKMAQAHEPYPMSHVKGEGVYEIPVGPIHAGIIEPGHFRFNVAGERIITLEGKLFFKHKGVEKLLENKTVEGALPFVERISTDMAASHALAFCQAVENCALVKIPPRASQLRTLIAELERITMHIHDLANIAGNGTGYTFMAAQGFRVKERLVRLSAQLLGNRFWRGMMIPGGVSRDFGPKELNLILESINEVCEEVFELVKIGKTSDGLRERLETTGILNRGAALAYGACGLTARASGVSRDVRVNHPYASYQNFEMVTGRAGDVYSRYRLRYKEIAISRDLIKKLLANLSNSEIRIEVKPSDGMGLSSVESWRGEIINWIRFKNGKIDRAVIRDPSFCNWPLFGELGPGNIVPDFPLCNKSLNLSYSGTDL